MYIPDFCTLHHCNIYILIIYELRHSKRIHLVFACIWESISLSYNKYPSNIFFLVFVYANILWNLVIKYYLYLIWYTWRTLVLSESTNCVTANDFLAFACISDSITSEINQYPSDKLSKGTIIFDDKFIPSVHVVCLWQYFFSLAA